MKYLKFIVLFLIIAAVITGFLLRKDNSEIESLNKKKDRVVSEINELLTKATLAGDYKCCIVPPCKMCFLGDWIWQDGSCDCDTEIAMGNWDNVCPECKIGVEEGRCSSTINPGTCVID